MTNRSIDARGFRTALSSFATGVTVVTARAETGENCGMTASSFNSFSMQPPLVLWSVTKSANSADVFRHAKQYAIHVLAADQQAVANQFATQGIDKFAHTDFYHDDNGVPVLQECAARFDCRQWAVYDGGDHWIVVGEVQGLAYRNQEALVFSEGAYATASPIRSTSDVELHSADSPVDRLLLYNLARAYHELSRQFHAGVRDSGLSIPQWRILASLYGRVSREFQDLQDRTFLDRESLKDAIAVLQQDGLCVLADAGGTVSGTDEGHERVRHLFEYGQQQEQAALGDKSMDQLIDLLAAVVRNTRREL